MTRARIKRLVERTLVMAGSEPAGRALLRNRALVLAYHNILPDRTQPPGEHSLHLPLEDFSWQLDELSRYCEVVPLANIVEPCRGTRRPRVAITFDDAYRGTVTHALPALARRGMPATIFVPPGLLGADAFWWDKLAGPDGTLDPMLRSELLDDKQGRAEYIEAWASAHRQEMTSLPTDAVPASQEELALAVSVGGITLGAHSWSHPNLLALDSAHMEEEMMRPMQWLKEHFPRQAIPWLSYPYGLHSSTVRDAARRAGYYGAVLIDGGWFRPDRVPPHAIPRLNIPCGISREGFALRLAGVFRR